MSAGEYCNRDVIVVSKNEPIREAIKLMRTHHTGDVVVVEKQDDAPVPVGILTDRDIVVEVLAEGVDLDAVNIGDVMSFELVTLDEETKLLGALKLLRAKGVRRAPVVNAHGGLIGILTVDDILDLIAEQLTDIVGAISSEQSREAKRRQ